MRILYLGNNWLGWQVLRWLRQRDEEIVGLVLHPERRRAHGEEILRTGGVPADRVFSGSKLRRPEVRQAIAALRPEIGLSVLFGYILKPELLNLFPRRVVNLHPSLLPYNRGAYPNVWSIIERTPAGTSLHYLDEGVDTGELIAQKEVEVEPVDTGETLYRKLERAALDLFRETWPRIANGSAVAHPQRLGGTCHHARDVQEIDEIDLDASYRARDLIDLLRARTFPPHEGAFFRTEGRRVNARIQLEYGRDAEIVGPPRRKDP